MERRCRRAGWRRRRPGAPDLAEYSNPRLPDEVNNRDARPLRSFFVLAGTLAVIGSLVVLVLAFLGGKLARYLPFEAEVVLIAPHAAKYPASGHAAEKYLQALAGRLLRHMQLPPGMSIQVHYVDQPVTNAFATLGGHVAVYRGLLERMPDENTLAMVLAHEIGHVRHRHPVASLGRGVALGAALTVVSATVGSGAADGILGNAGLLTLLSFSREQEEEADEVAIAALVAEYGHAGGAAGTFEVLRAAASERGKSEPPKFLSTHPVTTERIERLSTLVRHRGWTADGARAPIPEGVRAALRRDAEAVKDSRPRG